MSLYLLYCLDLDGHITRGTDINCADDTEALRAALRVTGMHASIEVWQAERRVAQVRLQDRVRGEPVSHLDMTLGRPATLPKAAAEPPRTKQAVKARQAERGYGRSDKPLAQRLISRVNAGEFASDWAACLHCADHPDGADKIAGPGTSNSRARRLLRIMKEIRKTTGKRPAVRT